MVYFKTRKITVAWIKKPTLIIICLRRSKSKMRTRMRGAPQKGSRAAAFSNSTRSNTANACVASIFKHEFASILVVATAPGSQEPPRVHNLSRRQQAGRQAASPRLRASFKTLTGPTGIRVTVGPHSARDPRGGIHVSGALFTFIGAGKPKPAAGAGQRWRVRAHVRGHLRGSRRTCRRRRET